MTMIVILTLAKSAVVNFKDTKHRYDHYDFSAAARSWAIRT